jgi:hypothetical protein
VTGIDCRRRPDTGTDRLQCQNEAII